MSADSTNDAVQYSYEPTAKLFKTMIGDQLEVLQTKVGLVFARDPENVDFRMTELDTENWTNIGFEEAEPLIKKHTATGLIEWALTKPLPSQKLATRSAH